jgi:hypothetical protein
MNDLTLWNSASGAAEFLDVSADTIHRRAIPWRDSPVPGKVRFKLLKLGNGTRMERRYYRPDLEALLVTA